MSSLTKPCIFCPNPASTQEHIWGNWILSGKHVPRTHTKHTIKTEIINKPGIPNQSMVRLRAGDPLGVNIKIVCSTCNSGWMSSLQTIAKPHLIPLFKGSPWALGIVAQRAIAQWAIMATMTAEYLSHDLSFVGVSQGERDFLRATQTPPPGWRVWIAPYNREKHVGQWVHTSVPILDAKDVPESTKGEIPQPNTQTTAFVIGNLFVCTMSSDDTKNIDGWNWQNAPRARSLLTQIWPVRQFLIGWPTQALTDRDVYDFSRAFFFGIDEFVRRMGY